MRYGSDGDEYVRVYSNCDAVRLAIDGASLGVRRRDPSAFPAAGLVWPVSFEKGNHTLSARCSCEGDGTAVETTIRQRWLHKPAPGNSARRKASFKLQIKKNY